MKGERGGLPSELWTANGYRLELGLRIFWSADLGFQGNGKTKQGENGLHGQLTDFQHKNVNDMDPEVVSGSA